MAADGSRWQVLARAPGLFPNAMRTTTYFMEMPDDAKLALHRLPADHGCRAVDLLASGARRQDSIAPVLVALLEPVAHASRHALEGRGTSGETDPKIGPGYSPEFDPGTVEGLNGSTKACYSWNT